MIALLAPLLLPALAAAQCTTRIRVGTFDEATPGAVAIMSDWLNDNKVGTECWTFYRQPSGGLSTAKLESGDLDLAYVGSTPYAAATARRGRLKAVALAHKKGGAQALIIPTSTYDQMHHWSNRRSRMDRPSARTSPSGRTCHYHRRTRSTARSP